MKHIFRLMYAMINLISLGCFVLFLFAIIALIYGQNGNLVNYTLWWKIITIVFCILFGTTGVVLNQKLHPMTEW